MVDGVPKGSFDYADPLNDGQIGLATRRSSRMAYYEVSSSRSRCSLNFFSSGLKSAKTSNETNVLAAAN